jgi:hypothetical protein
MSLDVSPLPPARGRRRVSRFPATWPPGQEIVEAHEHGVFIMAETFMSKHHLRRWGVRERKTRALSTALVFADIDTIPNDRRRIAFRAGLSYRHGQRSPDGHHPKAL